MSLGFKQEKGTERKEFRPDQTGQTDSGDALFESEWDELVIRFDQKSRSYRVSTASQETDLAAAKADI
jgi:hypothetical protein